MTLFDEMLTNGSLSLSNTHTSTCMRAHTHTRACAHAHYVAISSLKKVLINTK